MKSLLLKLFIILSTTLVFEKCSSKTEYVNELGKRFENQFGKMLYKYDFIILIPRRGCVGAIEQALHFFRYGEENNKHLFVFTYIFDEQGLLYDIRDSAALSKTNVFIDNSNIYFIPNTIERGYPYLLNVKQGKIISGQRFDLFAK